MRRILLSTLTGLLVLVPAAHAGVPRTPFTVTPAAPSISSPITAAWKVDRTPKRGETFGFELMIVPPKGVPIPANCATGARVKARAVRKGRVLQMTFRPGGGMPWLVPRPKVWCTGTAGLVLFRYLAPIDPFFEAIGRPLGKRTVPVVATPGEMVPNTTVRTPTKVTLLPGSSITASAPGRPDRSTPVSGVLRGTTLGSVTPNRDIAADAFYGPLQLSSFAPDPLCPGTASPGTTDVIGGSRLDIGANGSVRFSLSLAGSPAQVFGCGPAGALAGATTFPLTGTVGPKGLTEQALTGSTSGILLPGGTQGGLAANLVISVDLSGSS